MKRFNMPRPEFSDEITSICLREMDRLEIEADVLKKEQKVQLKALIEEVETIGIPKKFVLKKLPKKLGSGLFLHPEASSMKKGDVIGCYAGKVSFGVQNLYESGGSYVFSPLSDLHLTKEEQKKYDSKRKFHPSRLYYLRIDAEKEGNYTRYINHSSDPNIEAQLTHVKGDGLKESFFEIIYLVKKTIHPQEQLLVSYEDGEDCYWKAMGIQPFSIFPTTFMINQNLEVITSKN
jgi:hypothetical protein